jgi:hypothetical protein
LKKISLAALLLLVIGVIFLAQVQPLHNARDWFRDAQKVEVAVQPGDSYESLVNVPQSIGIDRRVVIQLTRDMNGNKPLVAGDHMIIPVARGAKLPPQTIKVLP